MTHVVLLPGNESGDLEERLRISARSFPGSSVTVLVREGAVPIGGCGDKAEFRMLSEGESATAALNEVVLEKSSSGDILVIVAGCGLDNGAIRCLKDLLHKHDQHAVVSPRFLDEEDPEYAVKYLPHHAVVPIPDVNCFLVKGRIVGNLGFFTDVSVSLVQALQEFSMRISRYGYSSVILNHTSIRCEKRYLLNGTEHYPDVARKYPEYDYARRLYDDVDRDPLDFFSEAMNRKGKRRILFYLSQVLPGYNGTAEYSFGLLGAFYRMYSTEYDIAIVISRAAFRFHRERIDGDIKVFYPDDEVGIGSFAPEIVFVTSQYFDPKHLIAPLSVAPRIVNVILDAISWRCFYIGEQMKESLYTLNASALALTDGLITISKSSLEDVEAFVPSFTGDALPKKYTYLAIEGDGDEKADPSALKAAGLSSSEKYVLIFGNEFYHKSVHEALDALKNTPLKKVVVGGSREQYGALGISVENVVFLKSGRIPESVMKAVYAFAHSIVFPSQYEGFGLPILKALYWRKMVFAYDNSLNREIIEKFSRNERQVILFRRFADLSSLVEDNLETYDFPEVALPNWNDVARETEGFVQEVISRPLDKNKVRLRWLFAKLFRYGSGRVASEGSHLVFGESVISLELIYNIVRAYFLRKIRRYFRIMRSAIDYRVHRIRKILKRI